jgi:hypothetical protein
MNLSTSLSSIVTPQRPDARRPMLGLGISLLLHVLAVGWLWHSGLSHRADADTGPVRQMEVRLVPIAPEAPAPAPAAHVAVPRSGPAPASGVRKPPQAQRRLRAEAPSPVPAAATGDVADSAAGNVDAAPRATSDPAPVAPAVDLSAARATARLVAREKANGLLTSADRKLVVDPNADRRVVSPLERARRVDCQTARAGSTNLLANVVSLAVDLAKNAVDDSGCKW